MRFSPQTLERHERLYLLLDAMEREVDSLNAPLEDFDADEFASSELDEE